MSLKEQLVQEINSLSETELKQIAEYMAFLKFRNRISATPIFDEASTAALYAEFAEEDRLLAEEGISNYVEVLTRA